MWKINGVTSIVVIFVLTACAKTMPPILDTRFVGKSATQRSQSVPNSYGLAMYAMGLSGLKNMVAILDLATSNTGTNIPGFPTCISAPGQAGSGQVIYSVTEQNCPSQDNWNPQNITKTIDSQGNTVKLTYNSQNATTPISLQFKPTAGNNSATHTLTITNENISITTETAQNGGALEQGLYTFTYSGNIDYSMQYQKTTNNQTQNGNTIDHTAQIQIQGQIDERGQTPKIELAAFTVSNYQLLVNRQPQVTNSSLTISSPQSGFSTLTNGVPVAQISFNQTLNFPNSSTLAKAVPVTIKSTSTAAQIQSQGASSNINFNSTPNDRVFDLLNTVYAAVIRIQY